MGKRIIIVFVALTVFLSMIGMAVFMLLPAVAKQFYPQKYSEYVVASAKKNGLDPFLVYAVIKVESDFDPNAMSNKNAKGLMQLMDETAKWVSQNSEMKKIEVNDLYDPELNIQIGCMYLKSLITEFKGNADYALAAYNGGSGNVSQWIKNKQVNTTDDLIKSIPFSETRYFLKKVKVSYKRYCLLYRRQKEENIFPEYMKLWKDFIDTEKLNPLPG